MDIDWPGFKIVHFDSSCFSGITAYNRLLLSKHFYETFKDYEYILIYQLDCLVFSDQLKQWCDGGWDYVGAPWLENHKEKAEPGDQFWAVGNGGLSLRRIESFLRVLRSRNVSWGG
jgi:hypothetical protein